MNASYVHNFFIERKEMGDGIFSKNNFDFVNNANS